MAILDPTTPEEKTAGVAAVHRHFISLIKRQGKTLDFAITKQELDAVIEDIWDGLRTVQYRSLITGRLSADIPDDLVFWLIAATVRERFDLIVEKGGG